MCVFRYCRDHAAGGSVAVPSDDTILRHRDVDGVRSYKVRGSAAWRLASALSPEAIQAYERRLAEQRERRKRRRCAAAAAGPVAPPAEVGDTVFQDALEPEMHPQPDDVNPCGIDKVVLLPRRSYGGLLVATLPCGRVCAAVPLAHAESLTQVYALLSTLVLEDTDVRCPLQYVIYDNACALARFARHPVRKDRTDAAVSLAGLTYVLDGFHQQNHTSCLDPTHALHMPEVLRARHPRLQDVNTQTAEQFFSWLDPFVRSAACMTPSVFRVFVQILIHLFNSFICASHGRRVRPRPVRVPPPLAGSRARQSAAAVDSDPAQLPDTVALPVRLRRNPRGVGIWGAGKYHWQRPSDTDRPPCKLVWFETLPDALDTTTAGIRWVAPCGWILLLHGSSYELCRVCARAMQAEGLL